MKLLKLARNTRFLLMSVTIMAIAAFGIYGASWATPAQADGGTGTVPGSGGGGGGGGGNGNGGGGGNSSNPTNPVDGTPSALGATCGTGPQAFSVQLPSDVTNPINIAGFGSVKLLSNTGGVGSGAVRVLFVPITTFRADLIAATELEPSPAGWTDLGCGVQTGGTVADGRALTYVMKGQQVCFNLPVGAAEAYSSLRVAYYDGRLARWVFLNTKVNATQACHASFRLLPTTFALFGSA